MPTRSLPVESRSRRRPSGAGFRRTATQMALSRCAIARRGADWYFWRGTPAIACVAAQPPCSWHLPEAGQATGGPCPALEAKWLHRHPVAPRNHDSDQARASTRLICATWGSRSSGEVPVRTGCSARVVARCRRGCWRWTGWTCGSRQGRPAGCWGERRGLDHHAADAAGPGPADAGEIRVLGRPPGDRAVLRQTGSMGRPSSARSCPAGRTCAR
jgi:hypothetical protein